MGISRNLLILVEFHKLGACHHSEFVDKLKKSGKIPDQERY